jgi:signal transduction histidine kinase
METVPTTNESIGVAYERAAEPVNIARCLADVATLLHGQLSHGMRLDMRVDHDLPAVTCNPFALQNSILNLVSNARDAMPNGGMIAVRAGTILRGNRDFVELRVIDNGVGMTPDTIARAFDPFFTTKCEGLGGIGLQMVERFVEDTGGQVFIESQYGAGTTVTLQLPASDRSFPSNATTHRRQIHEALLRSGRLQPLRPHRAP